MPEVTIIVEFETLDGREAEFIALLREHARRTLHEEPGCLRFELLKPVEPDGAPTPNRVMVSELYADQAALFAHEQNPRIASLRAVTRPLLKSRRVVMANALDIHPAETGMVPQELNASNDD